jgi:hypothetical protein
MKCGIPVESVRAGSFPGVASDAPSASGVALHQYSENPQSAFHPRSFITPQQGRK